MIVRSFIGKFAAGLGVAVLLAACSHVTEEDLNSLKENPNAAKGDPILVGALYPLTGSVSALGIASQRVLQIAEKEINDAGGVGGKPIKLVFGDGACDPNQTDKAINNLVSVQKVKIVIGGFCSSETLTSAPVVEANKVVLLSPGSNNKDITTAGDFVFRNYPSDRAQSEVLAEYTMEKGYKKVGLLVEEQPYTEGIADVYVEIVNKNGVLTVVEKFPKDASDFRTQITKLQAAQVDVFFIDLQNPDTAGLIVKQLQEAGVKGPFIMNDVAVGATKEVIETYKDYVENSVGAEVPYDMSNPGMEKLKEAYKNKYGEDLGYLSYMATNYDAVYIVKEALEKVGEDAVKVKDYLYTVKGRKGLAGTLSFDQNGDPTADYRHVLRMIKNGVAVDYKEANAMMKK